MIIAALVTLTATAFAAPMNGTYTIGKSANANFHTISAAVTALETAGVNGAVTMVIEKGVYNEKVEIHEINGTSATNTITFASASGDNSNTSIKQSKNEATLVIDGASNITFKNITIDHSTALFGNALLINGQIENVNFTGVAFEGIETPRGGIENASVLFAPVATNSTVAFNDCEINNGTIGMFKGGNVITEQPMANAAFFANAVASK